MTGTSSARQPPTPNGKPIFTIEQVIAQLTRTGTAWNGVGSNPVPNAGLGTITYGFSIRGPGLFVGAKREFQPLSAAQRDAVRQAARSGEIIVHSSRATSPPPT